MTDEVITDYYYSVPIVSQLKHSIAPYTSQSIGAAETVECLRSGDGLNSRWIDSTSALHFHMSKWRRV